MAYDIGQIGGSIVGALGLGAALAQWLKNRGENDGKKLDELGKFRLELRGEIKEIKTEAATQEAELRDEIKAIKAEAATQEAEQREQIDGLRARGDQTRREIERTRRDLEAVKFAFAVYRFRTREIFKMMRAGNPEWQTQADDLDKDHHEVDDLLHNPAVTGRRSIRGCRILFADDAPDSLEVFKMALEQSGAIVETAPDGRAALSAYNRSRAVGKPFDVLLLDYSMPHETGLDVLKIIRAGGDPICAALFTASGEIVTGELNGEVWVKPMSVEQLIAKIEALIQ